HLIQLDENWAHFVRRPYGTHGIYRALQGTCFAYNLGARRNFYCLLVDDIIPIRKILEDKPTLACQKPRRLWKATLVRDEVRIIHMVQESNRLLLHQVWDILHPRIPAKYQDIELLRGPLDFRKCALRVQHPVKASMFKLQVRGVRGTASAGFRVKLYNPLKRSSELVGTAPSRFEAYQLYDQALERLKQSHKSNPIIQDMPFNHQSPKWDELVKREGNL
ncbi:MAG: hypothetical protein OXQ96_00055, partial [Alphaproteobacteria bacterium]|nr:hypothetical protein [Alphaproteobacteria bacterium]